MSSRGAKLYALAVESQREEQWSSGKLPLCLRRRKVSIWQFCPLRRGRALSERSYWAGRRAGVNLQLVETGRKNRTTSR